MYMRELPGRVVDSPRPSARGLWVFVVACCAMGIFAFRHVRPTKAPASNKPGITSTPTTVPMGITEDVLRHVDAAVADQRKAVDEITRSRQWIERVMPTLEDERMTLEQKRLNLARAAGEAAKRHLQEAREELEIAKNLIEERSKTTP